MLVLVLLLGAALRCYDLSGVPTELIADELEFYNSAASVFTTGADVDGQLKPFFYSENPGRNPPAYSIAEYPFALALGRTPVALRLPAAIFGLLAVLLTYGLALRISQRYDVAALAGLFAAVAPVLVHFSRIAWQPASELPFLLGALYCLAVALHLGDEPANDGVRYGWLAAGAALAGLTAYTYMASWFYAFLLCGALLAFAAVRKPTKTRLLAIAGAVLAALVIAAPALWEIFVDPEGAERTVRIATFRFGVTPQALLEFGSNYVAHFRWSYLATTGDPIPGVTWRYLNGFGALYWWMVPLAALGLLGSFSYVRDAAWRWFLWVWLLAYPLGGALTDEGAPNAPRTLAGIPVFCVLGAIGAAMLFDWARRRKRLWGRRFATALLACGMVAAVGTSVGWFAWFYFTQYVHQASNAWDSGTRATFAEVRRNLNDDNIVCFSLRPAWYALDTYVRFYLPDVASNRIYASVDADACDLPGSILVTDSDHPYRRTGAVKLATIYDVDGNAFAYVYRRLGPARRPVRH